MAFTKKTWTDRNVEYPSRRRLVAVSGSSDTYDVVRAEGTITQEGDKVNATNMNDLESRISNAIDATETSVNNSINTLNSNVSNNYVKKTQFSLSGTTLTITN